MHWRVNCYYKINYYAAHTPYCTLVHNRLTEYSEQQFKAQEHWIRSAAAPSCPASQKPPQAAKKYSGGGRGKEQAAQATEQDEARSGPDAAEKSEY